MQGYLSSDSSKSDKVRKESEKYIEGLNDFFQKAAEGDDNAYGIIYQHRQEVIPFFSHIIRNKQGNLFPKSRAVLKECLKKGIIKKEDLQA